MQFITDADIKAQEEQLERLKRAKLAQDNTPLAELAVGLHDRFCGYNHTDGCAWLYECPNGNTHDWNGQAHQRWMERTEKVLGKFKHAALSGVPVGHMSYKEIGESVATRGWSAVAPEVILVFLDIMKETD